MRKVLALTVILIALVPSGPAANAVADSVASAEIAPLDSVPESRVSGNTRIWRQYTGSGYRVWAEARWLPFWGHFHIWGPNLDVNEPDTHWGVGEDTRPYTAAGSGTACAEAWFNNNGRFESMGQACIPV